MNGWLIALVMTCICIGAIIIFARLPRASWVLPCSAGALALAGYAYQGQPDVAASRAKPLGTSGDFAKQLIGIRQEMDMDFGRAKRYLITSDSSANSGNYVLAAAIVRNGLNKYPEDAELWSALGVHLMLASDGRLSEPAKLAFERSRKAWPKGPVPDYYYGLSALLDGRVDEAEALWSRALDTATPKAKYRAMLSRQLYSLQKIKKQAALSRE